MHSNPFSSSEGHLLIGEVTKAQGLRGELKVHCYSGQPGNLKAYRSLVFADNGNEFCQKYALHSSRSQGSAAIVQLEGITDRDAAERCVGKLVYVAKSDLPAPLDDEFYWHDIQGKKACTIDGREIGEIHHLFSNGAHDVMVIRDGRTEYLIPVVDGIVKTITPEAVVLDPPPGLLEMNISVDD